MNYDWMTSGNAECPALETDGFWHGNATNATRPTTVKSSKGIHALLRKMPLSLLLFSAIPNT
jgi:hypothetical protein